MWHPYENALDLGLYCDQLNSTLPDGRLYEGSKWRLTLKSVEMW